MFNPELSLISLFDLQNMFLAIINDTYSEVKAEIAMKRNEFEIGDYFKVNWEFGCLKYLILVSEAWYYMVINYNKCIS